MPPPHDLVPGLGGRLFQRPPVVAVLRLSGLIGGVGPLRRGMTVTETGPVIERAFALKRLKAVALAINSPGGSPVQAGLICRRIRALAEEKEIPVVAFAEDVAASGGYWLACAADEIFADENSIVGSIGVVSASFGFPGLLEKLGVDRRVHTQGALKGMLDPFRPEDPAHVVRLEAIQADMHESFKELVRARRGKRLKAGEDELFSGAFWTGRRALELGLIDGIGDLRSVMRDRFGPRLRLRAVGPRAGWLRRRLTRGRTEATAGALGAGLIAAVEDRALWARYGL
ncbi:MAG: S49 family peptidase [Alphaproteobacteria bacterium]